MEADDVHLLADPDILILGDRLVMIVSFWPTISDLPCVGMAIGGEAGSVGEGILDFQQHVMGCDSSDTVDGRTDPMALWVPDDRDDPRSGGDIHVWWRAPAA